MDVVYLNLYEVRLHRHPSYSVLNNVFSKSAHWEPFACVSCSFFTLIMFSLLPHTLVVVLFLNVLNIQLILFSSVPSNIYHCSLSNTQTQTHTQQKSKYYGTLTAIYNHHSLRVKVSWSVFLLALRGKLVRKQGSQTGWSGIDLTLNLTPHNVTSVYVSGSLSGLLMWFLWGYT